MGDQESINIPFLISDEFRDKMYRMMILRCDLGTVSIGYSDTGWSVSDSSLVQKKVYPNQGDPNSEIHRIE